MSKQRIQEIIVVEGKTDTAVIKELFDADTIETSGSGINDEIIAMIQEAAKRRGVIVLTDPDYPGTKIRQTIIDAVPEARHAFVNREDAIGKKKLGIAEARKDAIVEALNNAVTFTKDQTSITWEEFLALGVIGHKDRRDKLCQAFCLGHANNKTLFHRMNMFGLTYAEAEAALKD